MVIHNKQCTAPPLLKRRRRIGAESYLLSSTRAAYNTQQMSTISETVETTIGSLNRCRRQESKRRSYVFHMLYYCHRHNALLYNGAIGPYEIKKIIPQYNTVGVWGRGVCILYHASSSRSFGNRPVGLCAAEFFDFWHDESQDLSSLPGAFVYNNE